MIGMSAVKKNKVALVTGITGQDGSYLAELLLEKGYFVVGLKRRTSVICTERIDHIYGHKNFKVEYFDLNDVGCMYRLLQKYKPDEIYNLAAQSHVHRRCSAITQITHSMKNQRLCRHLLMPAPRSSRTT